MTNDDNENLLKIKCLEKRFYLKEYEFVYSSDEIKSYIKRISKRKSKYGFIDDPIFEM